MIRLVLLCILLCPAMSAFADSLRLQIVASTSSSHVVATYPRSAIFHIKHDGDRLIVTINAGIGRAAVLGHSPLIVGAEIKNGQAVLSLRPGTILRQVKQPSRTTIDLFPSVEVEARDQASPVPSTTNQASLIPGLPDAFAATVVGRAPSKGPPAAAAEERAPKHPGPPPATTAGAGSVTPPSGATNAITAKTTCETPVAGAVLLPFSPQVGVAALRRQNDVTFFFDEGRPIDLSSLRTDPTFSDARVVMHGDVTELLLQIDADRTFGLARQADGWCLRIGRTAPERTPIAVERWGAGLRFLLQAPGKVITATDPSSGAVLLIGTDRAANAAILVTHRSELFSIKRSAIGVVVEPFSDRMLLKATRGGFALAADDATGLSVPRDFADDQAAQTGLTHIMDVQPTTTMELARRLRGQLETAALTPARAKLSPRLAAAQSMLELGMGREARTLLQVAAADDPAASLDPRARFLQALADIADDASVTGAFGRPNLPVNDETTLWRALTQTTPVASPRSNATIVADAIALILAYPEHLRDIAAGLAAPLLLADGHPAALAALRRLPAGLETAVPKADGLLAAGDTAGGLAQLDLLARNPDLGVSTGATLSAILSRVHLSQLDPKAATDLLERHRLDWRATGREGAVMMDEAALARRAGQYLSAIQLWREIERRFSQLRQPAQSAIVDALGSLVDPRIATALSAADFVTIVAGSTAELAAHPDVAAELGPALADRLEALDLPARATDVLRKLMNATPAGPASARLGEKLASMLLEQGDLAGAQASLEQSDQPNLPPALDQQRRLTLARVLERQGKHAAALAALGALSGAPDQDVRAGILAADGRWHEAKLALLAMAKDLPEDGIFQPDQAELMMRLATAASRDGDRPLLERLARQAQGRWPDAEQRRIFDLITAPLLSDAKAPAGARPLTTGAQPANAG